MWRKPHSACRNNPWYNMCGRSPSYTADQPLCDKLHLLYICILTKPCQYLPFPHGLLQQGSACCPHQPGTWISSPLPDEPEPDYPLPVCISRTGVSTRYFTLMRFMARSTAASVSPATIATASPTKRRC